MYLKSNYIPQPDFKLYYIDHYYYKSTEEFINKVKRGSCFHGGNNYIKMGRIIKYFTFNQMNSKKIELFKNKTRINLTYIINESDRWKRKLYKNFKLMK